MRRGEAGGGGEYAAAAQSGRQDGADRGAGDWDHSEPLTAGLSIDGAEAVEVEALTVGPLVLVLMADAGLEARVKAARTLDWTLPWGAFHAEVEGLGAAYDAIEVC